LQQSVAKVEGAGTQGSERVQETMTETRVYLVSWDVERFQAYLYDLPDDELSLDDHMLFNGHSKLESWTPLPIYSDQPHLETARYLVPHGYLAARDERGGDRPVSAVHV
jgi:hypothetical protein